MFKFEPEHIAEICHEASRAYCGLFEDYSQKSWEDAPDWQRESVIHGVEHAIANPGVTPEDSHKSWLAEKEADGWVWGEKKDPEKKEHPCFMAYARLPKEQRQKDKLFLAIVRAFT